ncbi:MAG TPA: VOC family protein [Ignavibacteria bacterium]|nr:VOC family protein [Ignavibacteria bacterium]
MKFGHLEFFVDSPEKSVKFYCNYLGFEIVSDQGENFKWVKSDNLEILFRKGSTGFKPDTYHKSNIALCLYCSNLNYIIDKLKSENIVFQNIDNSEKCFAIRDPDGNWIQIVNPENILTT